MIDNKNVDIILDMDNTLLSIDCLDTVVETALGSKLIPDAVTKAMIKVRRETKKGMVGKSKLSETIPARLNIAKNLGAPVLHEHFEIVAHIVINTLTEILVNSLKHELSTLKENPITITIVSGGPQICFLDD